MVVKEDSMIMAFIMAPYLPEKCFFDALRLQRIFHFPKADSLKEAKSLLILQKRFLSLYIIRVLPSTKVTGMTIMLQGLKSGIRMPKPGRKPN